MQLVASASKTVFRKNLTIVVLCLLTACWFAYDGWKGWPEANDATIQLAREKYLDRIRADQQGAIINWQGWNNSPYDTQKEVSDALISASVNGASKWHSPLDIVVQKIITACMVGCTALAIWWVLHCQKRRATANETTLSPADGVSFPWSAITKVDNTRWKKSGIVYVHYKDATGAEKRAVLDDYHLDNLRPILKELAERAEKAEFVPPPDAPADTPAASA